MDLNEWVAEGGRTPKEVKMERSARTVYLICFWHCEGILFEENVPKDVTTIKETYFNLSVRHRDAMKTKWPEKLSKKILLLHDNASAHKAALIQKLFAVF